MSFDDRHLAGCRLPHFVEERVEVGVTVDILCSVTRHQSVHCWDLCSRHQSFLDHVHPGMRRVNDLQHAAGQPFGERQRLDALGFLLLTNPEDAHVLALVGQGNDLVVDLHIPHVGSALGEGETLFSLRYRKPCLWQSLQFIACRHLVVRCNTKPDFVCVFSDCEEESLASIVEEEMLEASYHFLSIGGREENIFRKNGSHARPDGCSTFTSDGDILHDP